MSATPYKYTGTDVREYPFYKDAQTGQVLTCVPGQNYTMVPTNPSATVPPDPRFSLHVVEEPVEEPETDPATEEEGK